jgi:hypothetical protein
MAGFASIAAAGVSIVRMLNHAFDDDEPIPSSQTQATLVQTNDFDKAANSPLFGKNTLTVFLYRIDFNKVMRAAWSGAGAIAGRAHLALDLHYLLTAWSENAEHEHLILGRALQCIEETPVLAGPLLHPEGAWAPHEGLQLVMEDVPTEALMRTFDSLPTDYRLSVPYIARVLRIDGRQKRPEPPVRTAVRGLVPSMTR